MTHRVPGPRSLSRRGFLITSAGAAAGLAGATAATRTARGAGAFRVPIDSAPHRRTWMAWPDSSAIWRGQLGGVQSDIARIARTIAEYEQVVICANADSVSTAQSMCGSAVTVIGSIPVDDCWMRDTGPIFRIDGGGRIDAVGLNFNGWGNKQTHAKDALVAQRVAAYTGVGFTAADLVSEGGAIETDASGTLMATTSSVVNSNRNPGRTQTQLGAAMCAAYGATKVIWFDGIKGRDITDDHVDATSRFLAAGQALVQVPHPGDTDIWSDDERQQKRTLLASTDASGHGIAVAPCQGPDYTVIRQAGHPNFVGSYANYYVCNGAVISAQFGDAAADRRARSTLQSLFPGRTVEQLNIDNLGLGGGGIHCVTQPEPGV